MAATAIAFVLLAGIMVWVIVAPRLKDAKRRHIRAEPWPDEWDPILAERVPLYIALPPKLRAQLQGDIKVFVAEKQFVGCGGQEITDEIKVTIAAQACMLTLNRPNRYYPRLQTIYVYPSAYITRMRNQVGGLISEGQGVNLGESWGDGRLVLAWDASRHGAINIHDGKNVVFHEFAHQLDQEDGAGDGVPFLDAPAKYAQWLEVLGGEFERLQKRRRHRRGVIDSYGATNPAEFFSTATEAFFEKPHQMRRKMPELYDELSDYYKVDPAGWQ